MREGLESRGKGWLWEREKGSGRSGERGERDREENRREGCQNSLQSRERGGEMGRILNEIKKGSKEEERLRG